MVQPQCLEIVLERIPGTILEDPRDLAPALDRRFHSPLGIDQQGFTGPFPHREIDHGIGRIVEAAVTAALLNVRACALRTD